MENVIAYVDGSYNDGLKKYAFGCVFIIGNKLYQAYGNGDDPDSLKQRNVSGEMLGAMYATQCARKSGLKKIDIFYDYSGIECWVTGAWKAKNEHTKMYAQAMRSWMGTIDIAFHKVESHTGVQYNEAADRLAKKGLTEGNGIPVVKAIEELEEYSI